LQVTKALNIRSFEIAICKILIGSEPSDQVLIGGLLFSLPFNSLVWNLLVKQTHDCQLVGVSVAETIVFFLLKEMRSGTTVRVNKRK
jgi:hypothetical protein